MRLSVKGRYALAASVVLAEESLSNEYITLISISERLGISKIYLEQVFSLLKRGKIVTSVKGSQGGYQLSESSHKITVYDILHAVETSLFEKTEETLSGKAPEIEAALCSIIYNPLDETLQSKLKSITLNDLVEEARRNNSDQLMFYI